MLKRMLVLGLVVALTNSVSATTWTGASSDDWNDTGNWDTGIVPQGPIAVGGIGSGGDLIMSPTATFQPVANAGETIGGTVINNFATTTPGGYSLITFESGSTGDFYNITGPHADDTATIEYDIQAGAVVNVSNSFTQSYSTNGALVMTLGGTITIVNGEYYNGGNGRGSFDILPGGVMTVPGDKTSSLDGWIGDGYLSTSAAGYHVESSYDGGSDTTSVFAVVPEPASLVLLGLSGLAMASMGRRKFVCS